MLTSLRKFSSSIYAKILLGIIIIPFVFWGMGSSFFAGNKNIVIIIDDDKYSTQDLSNFIQTFSSVKQNITGDQIEEILSAFIGQKLIQKEADHFGINLSDKSIRLLLMNQKKFMRNDEFSRTEYEKFLVENNITASFFEKNLFNQERKKHLLDFIGGGIVPSNFMVNLSYDAINQKRNILLINLEDFFNREFNFSEEQIKTYYKNNKENYKEIYKSIKLLELNPLNLVNSDEYSDLFFKKIDELDDMIINGENFDVIAKKFNLPTEKKITLNRIGKDLNYKSIELIPDSLAQKIFDLGESQKTALFETQEKYFIVELIKTEEVQRKLDDVSLKKNISLTLKKKSKRNFISEIMSKINKNEYTKLDFDNLSKEKKIPIQKIVLLNQNDYKILEEYLVRRIYSTTEKEILLLHDFELTKNFLIYVEKIENVSIDEKTEEFKQYSNISKIKLANKLFNTYDNYIKEKYEIEINYKALDTVKNYFN